MGSADHSAWSNILVGGTGWSTWGTVHGAHGGTHGGVHGGYAVGYTWWVYMVGTRLGIHECRYTGGCTWMQVGDIPATWVYIECTWVHMLVRGWDFTWNEGPLKRGLTRSRGCIKWGLHEWGCMKWDFYEGRVAWSEIFMKEGLGGRLEGLFVNKSLNKNCKMRAKCLSLQSIWTFQKVTKSDIKWHIEWHWWVEQKRNTTEWHYRVSERTHVLWTCWCHFLMALKEERGAVHRWPRHTLTDWLAFW